MQVYGAHYIRMSASYNCCRIDSVLHAGVLFTKQALEEAKTPAVKVTVSAPAAKAASASLSVADAKATDQTQVAATKAAGAATADVTA